MRNPYTDYLRLLQTFTIQEQIDETNDLIYKLARDKLDANKQDKRYDRIKEFKHMKNKLINKLHT